MSAWGQARHFERAPATFGLPLTPDVSLRRNEPPVWANGRQLRAARHRTGNAIFILASAFRRSGSLPWEGSIWSTGGKYPSGIGGPPNNRIELWHAGNNKQVRRAESR
jgi:hypothetical protein